MSSKQRVYGQNPMATSRRRDINNIKSNSGMNKSNTTRTTQSRQPLLDMENINPQHQKQKQRLSKQIANNQRDKSYLYNVNNKSSSKVVEKELSKKKQQQRAASKSQSRTSTKSNRRTSKSKVSKPTQVPVNNNSNNNNSNNNTAISNQSMPQVISFEEFKTIRRSGSTLPTLPLSQSSSSTIMWSPTREEQSRGNQQKGRVGKQQRRKEGRATAAAAAAKREDDSANVI